MYGGFFADPLSRRSHSGSSFVLASLQPPCLKGGRLRPTNLILCLSRNLQGYFIPSHMRWDVVFVCTQGFFPYYRFWSDHAGKRGQARTLRTPFCPGTRRGSTSLASLSPAVSRLFPIGTTALGFAWRIGQTCRGRSGHR